MSRGRLLASALVAVAVLVAAVALLTPWQPLGAQGPAVQPDVGHAFTAAEIARAAALRQRLGPWPYVALLLALAVPWVLFAAVTARRGRTSPTLHRRWPTVLLTVVAVAAAQWLLTLPMAWHSEVVLREFRLSTQSWAAWLRDEAVTWGITVGVTAVAVLGLVWLVRRAPRRWPWLLAAAAALVTVVGSTVYPVVVESAYNRFTPMPDGTLSRRIEALAARDGLGRVSIVVSDASTRTTGENAHVSGLAGTRRVVIDDTTFARGRSDPDALLAVVAHELGHVVHHDVARGTAIGAAGVVAAVLLLGWLATTRRGRRAFDPTSGRRRDLVRSVLLVLAVAGTAPVLAAPVTNVVSRHIEAAADVHALDLTRDVPAYVRMQHDLATTNLSRLDARWWQTMFFATHPDPAWRIALASAWQRSSR